MESGGGELGKTGEKAKIPEIEAFKVFKEIAAARQVYNSAVSPRERDSYIGIGFEPSEVGGDESRVWIWNINADGSVVWSRHFDPSKADKPFAVDELIKPQTWGETNPDQIAGMAKFRDVALWGMYRLLFKYNAIHPQDLEELAAKYSVNLDNIRTIFAHLARQIIQDLSIELWMKCLGNFVNQEAGWKG
jgi:hypothetical protein